jgi:hypothetical protein
MLHDLKPAGKVESVGHLAASLRNHKQHLLLVYGSYCGHCHVFFSTWKKLHGLLPSTDTGVLALETSALQESNSSSSNSSKSNSSKSSSSASTDRQALDLVRELRDRVYGVPCIALFDSTDMSLSEYQGPRTSESILEFVNARRLPTSAKVSSAKVSSKARKTAAKTAAKVSSAKVSSAKVTAAKVSSAARALTKRRAKA